MPWLRHLVLTLPCRLPAAAELGRLTQLASLRLLAEAPADSQPLKLLTHEVGRCDASFNTADWRAGIEPLTGVPRTVN
jgi:hypothetical protein